MKKACKPLCIFLSLLLLIACLSITVSADTNYIASDILSIEFFAIRDIFPNESIFNGLAARVTFEDNETFVYDYLYYDNKQVDIRMMIENFLQWGYDPWESRSSITVNGDTGKIGEIEVTIELKIEGTKYRNITYNHSVKPNVVENPIDTIEILGGSPKVFTNDAKDLVGGYYDEEKDEYLEYTYKGYEEYYPYGIKINYTNGNENLIFGTSYTGSGTVFDGISYTCHYDELIDDLPYEKAHYYTDNLRHTVEFVSKQSLTHWEADNSYPVTIKILGKEVTYYVDVVEGSRVVPDDVWKTENIVAIEFSSYKSISTNEWVGNGMQAHILYDDGSRGADAWYKFNDPDFNEIEIGEAQERDLRELLLKNDYLHLTPNISPDDLGSLDVSINLILSNTPYSNIVYNKIVTIDVTNQFKSVIGDANSNGVVEIMDATAIQRYIAAFSISAFNELTADVDQDGSVTIMDATKIQRYLASFSDNTQIGVEFVA